jgi:hypothetical protein
LDDRDVPQVLHECPRPGHGTHIRASSTAKASWTPTPAQMRAKRRKQVLMEALKRHADHRTEQTEVSRPMQALADLPPSEALSDQDGGEVIEVGAGGT